MGIPCQKFASLSKSLSNAPSDPTYNSAVEQLLAILSFHFVQGGERTEERKTTGEISVG